MISRSFQQMAKFSLTTSLIAFLFTLNLSAQITRVRDYQPRSRYTSDSVQLVYQINVQVNEEVERTKSPKKYEINKYYEATGKHLRKLVYDDKLISDASLQQFVTTIAARITTANKIYHPPKLILICRDAQVNAASYGEGTLSINIGMISKIGNESQLAFAIAHEIAHYELQHFRNKITYAVENGYSAKEKESMRQLKKDNASAEDMQALRELWYSSTAYSRENEFEADSLGFILFKNAGYAQEEALSLLSLLDPTKLSNALELDFILQLDFEEYPLKDEWFKKRLSLYSKESSLTFFSNDSLETHPDIDLRKDIIRSQIEPRNLLVDQQPTSFVNECIRIAKFEAVESAYVNKQFDLCLYLALTLRMQYPDNPYLVSMISKVLIEVYEVKDFPFEFGLLVSTKTANYNEELRFVNDFLHNIKKDDLGTVAFHFQSALSNFDYDKEEHYYLLWRICSMSDRLDVRDKVKNEYSQKFKRGFYQSRMIVYRPYKRKQDKLLYKMGVR